MEKKQTVTYEQVINNADQTWMNLKSGIDHATAGKTQQEILQRLEQLLKGVLPTLQTLRADVHLLLNYEHAAVALEIPSYNDLTECSVEEDPTCPICGGELDSVVDEAKEPHAYTCTGCGAYWDYEDIHGEERG